MSCPMINSKVKVLFTLCILTCITYVLIHYKWFLNTRSLNAIQSDWSLIESMSKRPSQCKVKGNEFNDLFTLAKKSSYYEKNKDKPILIKNKFLNEWNSLSYIRHIYEGQISDQDFLAIFGKEVFHKWAVEGRDIIRRILSGTNTFINIKPFLDKAQYTSLNSYINHVVKSGNSETLLELEKLSQRIIACGSMIDSYIGVGIYKRLLAHKYNFKILKRPNDKTILAILARELLSQRQTIRKNLSKNDLFIQIRPTKTPGNSHLIEQMPLIKRSFARDARAWEDIVGANYRHLHENLNTPIFHHLMSQKELDTPLMSIHLILISFNSSLALLNKLRSEEKDSKHVQKEIKSGASSGEKGSKHVQKEIEKLKEGFPYPHEKCEESEMKADLRAVRIAKSPSGSSADINLNNEIRTFKEGDRFQEYKIISLQIGRVVLFNKKKYECLSVRKNKEQATSPRSLYEQTYSKKPNDKVNINPLYSGVKEIAPGRYIINQAMLNEQLNDLDSVYQQGRIIPYYKKGKAVGFKIVGIRSNSIFRHLGLKSGDILKSIGGEELLKISNIQNIPKKLKTMKDLSLHFERRGKMKVFEYSIK